MGRAFMGDEKLCAGHGVELNELLGQWADNVGQEIDVMGCGGQNQFKGLFMLDGDSWAVPLRRDWEKNLIICGKFDLAAVVRAQGMVTEVHWIGNFNSGTNRDQEGQPRRYWTRRNQRPAPTVAPSGLLVRGPGVRVRQTKSSISENAAPSRPAFMKQSAGGQPRAAWGTVDTPRAASPGEARSHPLAAPPKARPPPPPIPKAQPQALPAPKATPKAAQQRLPQWEQDPDESDPDVIVLYDAAKQEEEETEEEEAEQEGENEEEKNEEAAEKEREDWKQERRGGERKSEAEKEERKQKKKARRRAEKETKGSDSSDKKNEKQEKDNRREKPPPPPPRLPNTVEEMKEGKLPETQISTEAWAELNQALATLAESHDHGALQCEREISLSFRDPPQSKAKSQVAQPSYSIPPVGLRVDAPTFTPGALRQPVQVKPAVRSTALPVTSATPSEELSQEIRSDLEAEKKLLQRKAQLELLQRRIAAKAKSRSRIV